jgi:hypothetical protein
MFRRVEAPSPQTFHGPVYYPNGVALDDGDTTWLIKNGKKFQFYSSRAFDSWNVMAGLCEPSNIEHLKRGGIVGFREGTLLSRFSAGTLWLVSDNKTRQLVDPDALTVYGLLGRTIYEVSDNEFKVHEQGEPLNV